MDKTFILSIVGAAAWIPQLITWGIRLFTKTKLNFIAENKTEVGYTFLGPIFNHSFAISASKKDALIDTVMAEISHEKGETHKFMWQFLDEKGAELTASDGNKMEWRKNQAAIALKVVTSSLTEKKIGFQDLEFQKKMNELIFKCQELYSHLMKTKPKTCKEEVLGSKEYANLKDYVDKAFYWKEGRYCVKITAHIMSTSFSHTEEFYFQLTNAEVESLRKNIAQLKDYISDFIQNDGILKKVYPWNWATPQFLPK